MAITRFDGEYRWLSNFWPAPITFQDLTYPSVEHAYQAAKCAPENLTTRRLFLHGTAAQAKALGRNIKLRNDWPQVKDQVMTVLVQYKFANHPDLAAKLLATGNQEIVEGNYWHDNLWGNCTCARCADIPGENRLGKLLMQIREQLRKDN